MRWNPTLRGRNAAWWLLTLIGIASFVALTRVNAVSGTKEFEHQFSQLPHSGSCGELPIFGVSTHRGRNSDDTNIDLVNQLRARIVRIQIPWIEVEAGGKFDFERFDHLISGLRKSKKSILLVLAYGHPDHASGGLASGFPFAPRTPEQRQAYFSYLKAVVEHFHGPDISYQIWNEPNLKKFWSLSATDFGVLLKGAIKAIQEADPDAKIVAPGIANESNRYTFIHEVTKAIGAEKISGYAFHPYRQDGPENGLDDIVKFERASSAVRHLPMWISEWGYSETWLSRTYSADNLRDRQAVMTARLMLIAAIARVRAALLYDLIDDGTNPSNPEYRFGLYDYDFRAKKAATAFRTINDLMSKCRTYKFALDLTNKIAIATFTGASDISRVFWKYRGRDEHVLCFKRSGTKAARLFDISGAVLPIEHCSDSSEIKLTLREDLGPLILTVDL